MQVPLPYGRTELCPVRALARWLDAAAITDGRCSAASGCRPRPPRMPPCLARDRQCAADAALDRAHRPGACRGGGVRAARVRRSQPQARRLSTGMQAGAHAAQLKRLGRHKSFDVLGEYLQTV